MKIERKLYSVWNKAFFPLGIIADGMRDRKRYFSEKRDCKSLFFTLSICFKMRNENFKFLYSRFHFRCFLATTLILFTWSPAEVAVCDVSAATSFEIEAMLFKAAFISSELAAISSAVADTSCICVETLLMWLTISENEDPAVRMTVMPSEASD